MERVCDLSLAPLPLTLLITTGGAVAEYLVPRCINVTLMMAPVFSSNTRPSGMTSGANLARTRFRWETKLVPASFTKARFPWDLSVVMEGELVRPRLSGSE